MTASVPLIDCLVEFQVFSPVHVPVVVLRPHFITNGILDERIGDLALIQEAVRSQLATITLPESRLSGQVIPWLNCCQQGDAFIEAFCKHSVGSSTNQTLNRSALMRSGIARITVSLARI